MRRILSILFSLATVAILSFGCGGSAAGPATPTSVPVAIEGLDGESGIGVDSEFKFTSSTVIDSSTVSSSTFFMVQGVCSVSNCNSANALAATIICAPTDAPTLCTLIPTQSLSCGAAYCVCMTTDILDINGSSVLTSDLRADFTTADCVDLSATVTDANGTIISSEGTTNGVDSTSFNLSFSENVAASSVLNSGVSYACSALPATLTEPTITVAAGATNDSYDVTVNRDSDAYNYQLQTCVLTLNSSITKASGGAAFSGDITYSFRDACSIDDAFNADSSSCYTVNTTFSPTWTTWTALLANILTFSPDAGTLNYSATQAGLGSVEKSVTIDDGAMSGGADGFEAIIHFKTATGIDSPAVGEDSEDYVGLGLRTSGGEASFSLYIEGSTGTQDCRVMYSSGDDTPVTYRADCDSGTEYQIKLTVLDDGATQDYIRAYYKVDSGAFIQMVPQGGSNPFPAASTFLGLYGSSSWLLSLDFNNLGNGGSATIDSITSTGLSE